LGQGLELSFGTTAEPVAAPLERKYAPDLSDVARFDANMAETAEAWEKFLVHWNNFQKSFRDQEWEDANAELIKAITWKNIGAHGDLPERAVALIRLTEEVDGWTDPRYQNPAAKENVAAALIGWAKKFAPRSVSLHLSLARYYMGPGGYDPNKAINHYSLAADCVWEDLPALQRALGWLFIYPLAVLWLFGLVFCALLALRYFVLLNRDFSAYFPGGGLPGPVRVLPAILLLLLPVAAGLSSWWLLSWLIVVFSIYMIKEELAFAFLWFALLFASPLLLERHSRMAGARADEDLWAAVRVRNGVALADDLSRLEQAYRKNPGDPIIKFSHARLLQKRGELYRASEVYLNGIDDEDPAVQLAVYNNLAEIYLAKAYQHARKRGRVEREGVLQWGRDKEELNDGYRALKKAESIGADIGERRFEIQYNLSRYLEEKEGIKGSDEWATAISLGGERMNDLTDRFSRYCLNRHLTAMPFPEKKLLDRLLSGNPEHYGPILSGVWRKWMGPPGRMAFLAANGATLLALIILLFLKRRWKLSFRCASCGDIIGPDRGQSVNDPSICSPCFHVFRGTGSVDLKEKMEKRGQVQVYHERWARIGMLTSLLFPGAGQVLLGKTARGFVLLLLASLLAGAALAGVLIWPASGPVYQGGLSGHVIAGILVYLILVAVSVLLMRFTGESLE